MTIAQHSELQNILNHFESLEPDQVEHAFLSLWKPFVLSLSTEDDRALAFKLIYEWQTSRVDTLLNILQEEQPLPAAA